MSDDPLLRRSTTRREFAIPIHLGSWRCQISTWTIGPMMSVGAPPGSTWAVDDWPVRQLSPN